MEQTGKSVQIKHLQILSFILDEQSFGTEISCIQEVLEYKPLRPVPHAPEIMKGIIHLRGSVIPVVDLREDFGMSITPPTVDSCIIIVSLNLNEEKTLIGIVADRVQEVLEIEVNEIKPAPKLGHQLHCPFIYGMVHLQEQFIILLRLSRIFSAEQLQGVMEHTDSLDDETR